MAECRVCRGCAEEGKPLRHPCRCRGSIAYVHDDCLEQWLRQSGAASCELCGYRYAFSRQYAAGAPEKLPTLILASYIVSRGSERIRSFLRALLFIVLGGLVKPLCTLCIAGMYLSVNPVTTLRYFWPRPYFAVPLGMLLSFPAGIMRLYCPEPMLEELGFDGRPRDEELGNWETRALLRRLLSGLCMNAVTLGFLVLEPAVLGAMFSCRGPLACLVAGYTMSAMLLCALFAEQLPLVVTALDNVSRSLYNSLPQPTALGAHVPKAALFFWIYGVLPLVNGLTLNASFFYSGLLAEPYGGISGLFGRHPVLIALLSFVLGFPVVETATRLFGAGFGELLALIHGGYIVEAIKRSAKTLVTSLLIVFYVVFVPSTVASRWGMLGFNKLDVGDLVSGLVLLATFEQAEEVRVLMARAVISTYRRFSAGLPGCMISLLLVCAVCILLLVPVCIMGRMMATSVSNPVRITRLGFHCLALAYILQSTTVGPLATITNTASASVFAWTLYNCGVSSPGTVALIGVLSLECMRVMIGEASEVRTGILAVFLMGLTVSFFTTNFVLVICSVLLVLDMPLLYDWTHELRAKLRDDLFSKIRVVDYQEQQSCPVELRQAAALREKQLKVAASEQLAQFKSFAETNSDVALASIRREMEQVDMEEALILLRNKVDKFAAFLEHETEGRASCTKVAPEEALSAADKVARQGVLVDTAWALSNAAVPQAQEGCPLLYFRLQRSLVQRCLVHGLGTLSRKKLLKLFQNPVDLDTALEKSHVLGLIRDRGAPQFPVTLHTSFQGCLTADDQRPRTAHFVLVCAYKDQCDTSKGARVVVESSDRLRHLVLYYYAPVGKQTARQDVKCLAAVARQQEQVASWAESTFLREEGGKGMARSSSVWGSVLSEMENRRRRLELELIALASVALLVFWLTDVRLLRATTSVTARPERDAALEALEAARLAAGCPEHEGLFLDSAGAACVRSCAANELLTLNDAGNYQCKAPQPPPASLSQPTLERAMAVTPRAAGVFVALYVYNESTPEHARSMARWIASVADYNRGSATRYPGLVFHHGPARLWATEDVRGAAAREGDDVDVLWVDVERLRPFEVPAHVVPLVPAESLRTGLFAPQCHGRGWPAGYVFMIRFRLALMWQYLELLSRFSYVFQLDFDCTLDRAAEDGRFDVFAELERPATANCARQAAMPVADAVVGSAAGRSGPCTGLLLGATVAGAPEEALLPPSLGGPATQRRLHSALCSASAALGVPCACLCAVRRDAAGAAGLAATPEWRALMRAQPSRAAALHAYAASLGRCARSEAPVWMAGDARWRLLTLLVAEGVELWLLAAGDDEQPQLCAVPEERVAKAFGGFAQELRVLSEDAHNGGFLPGLPHSLEDHASAFFLKQQRHCARFFLGAKSVQEGDLMGSCIRELLPKLANAPQGTEGGQFLKALQGQHAVLAVMCSDALWENEPLDEEAVLADIELAVPSKR
eukprot:m51a1_g6783 hypothetical protein (1472) ;mRNA; f:138144-144047